MNLKHSANTSFPSYFINTAFNKQCSQTYSLMILQRNSLIGYENIYRERFVLRNWLTQLWRLTSLSLPWGLVVDDPREPMVQMKSEGHLLQCGLLLRGLKFFGCWSIQTSPDWVWPTHIREGNLLYSKVCVCVHACMCAMSLQSCLTLCNPMDWNLPGSSVHGILQEWILEWGAMPSSSGSSQLRDQTPISFISRWVLHN